MTSTSWLHVSFEGDEAPWTLRELPGMGYAAFATRSFHAGDLICTEKPTVWVHGHHPFDQTQLTEIDERVGNLSKEEQDAFYAMSNAFPDAATPAAGIFMTNCFDMADAPHGESCAMYLAIARLNHSCIPNVQQTHLPDTGEEVLYAVRDINIGDELNDCYIDLRQSTVLRQAALQDIYRFTCTCAACNNGDDGDIGAESHQYHIEDDRRRTRAAEFDDRIFEAVNEDDGGTDTALEIAYDAVRLLSAKDCLKWSVRYLADAHMSVYQLEVACGTKGNKALKHLKAAHTLNMQLTGPRSPESRNTAEKLGITTS